MKSLHLEAGFPDTIGRIARCAGCKVHAREKSVMPWGTRVNRLGGVGPLIEGFSSKYLIAHDRLILAGAAFARPIGTA